MDLKTLGKNVIDLAPAIGSVLLGAPGAAGGVAIKALASAFGLSDDETTPERIAALIAGDPEAALKLRQADAAFQIEMRKLDIEELKAWISDTDSARQRQTEHERATGKTDINIYILAWVLVVGFFLLIAVLMCVEIPTANREASAILMGAVAAGFGAVWQYFFGSSKSSREKTEIMAQLGIGGGKR